MDIGGTDRVTSAIFVCFAIAIIIDAIAIIFVGARRRTFEPAVAVTEEGGASAFTQVAGCFGLTGCGPGGVGGIGITCLVGVAAVVALALVPDAARIAIVGRTTCWQGGDKASRRGSKDAVTTGPPPVHEAVAVVVFPIAARLRQLIILTIIGTGTANPALGSPTTLERSLADPLLFGTRGTSEVVVRFSVAVVIFAVTGLLCGEHLTQAGTPLTFLAGLFAFFALPGTFAGCGARITALLHPIGFAVAVIVFAVAGLLLGGDLSYTGAPLAILIAGLCTFLTFASVFGPTGPGVAFAGLA
jgi:hypothetical protein